MAIKVKLRSKSISGNRQSLYLDFYPPIPHPKTDKPTRREFLNLFLQNEIEIEEQKYFDDKGKEQKRFVTVLRKDGEQKKVKLNAFEKQHNEETWKLAEQIRQKRENQLNKPEIYNGYEREQLKIKERENTSFLDYFNQLANKRKSSNHDNWISASHYIIKFSGGKLKFADLNEKFCNDFRDYICTTPSSCSSKTTLSQNSASSYFNKFKAALKQAYKEGYLQIDLNVRIDRLKEAETQRDFLTLDELNNLVKTECEKPVLKNAALFSALTGLRFSDIEKLKWGDVEYIHDNGYFIRFVQQKTKGVEMMPISDQACSLFGKRGHPGDKVFIGMTYSAYSNKHLAKWIGLAGITKDITFHCFRHTYATLQLSKGTDIYTVSKMLGNRSLKTTQIYARIIDQTKRDASDKIKLKF
jgi:integrase